MEPTSRCRDELYAVDRDVIRSAIIYQHDVVQPVGDPVGLVDEDVWFNAREPQAQTFVKDGDAFTVVANHFKSKSPGAADRRQRRRRATARASGTATACARRESLADVHRRAAQVDRRRRRDRSWATSTPTPRRTRSRRSARPATPTSAARSTRRATATCSTPLSGSLDHAFATAALTEKVTGFAHWNINSVESFAYQYVGDPALYAPNPYRSSDHDPLVLGIDLEERCQGLAADHRRDRRRRRHLGYHGRRRDRRSRRGRRSSPAATSEDVICGGAGNDTMARANGDDVVIGGFGDDTLERRQR